MDRRAKIDIRGTYRNHSPVFNDTRNGLGYGLAIPSGKFEPRPLQQSFPYLDEDPFEIDADTEAVSGEDLGAADETQGGDKEYPGTPR